MTAGDRKAELVAELAKAHDCTVAVAESLTGGLLTSKLAAATEASKWLRGGVVAYSPEVKYRLLGVPEGPVVTGEAAASMAVSVANLLEADVALAVTGVGGPGPEEGQPPGTVWAAFYLEGRVEAVLLELTGQDPGAICEATCERSLEMLAGRMAGAPKGPLGATPARTAQ